MRMNRMHIALAFVFMELAMTAWLVVGSFVTYAEPITATQMQNIYLHRIVRFGATLALLQLGTIAMIVFKSRRNAANQASS